MDENRTTFLQQLREGCEPFERPWVQKSWSYIQ